MYFKMIEGNGDPRGLRNNLPSPAFQSNYRAKFKHSHYWQVAKVQGVKKGAAILFNFEYNRIGKCRVVAVKIHLWHQCIGI